MTRLSRLLAPQVMAHRPPLRPRFWVYSAVAYLVPVIVQVAWPNSESIGDELVWLVTLVPAFLLALHYGLRGALAGLVLGTLLFVVVQVVLALNFTPDDWHITLPILIAYGTLALMKVPAQVILSLLLAMFVSREVRGMSAMRTIHREIGPQATERSPSHS